MTRFSILVALLFSCPAQAVVTIDWVTVGDSGNVADTDVMTCCGSSIGTSGYGAVSYEYQIGKFEITNAQYVEFLNAVAAADPNGLYDTEMGAGTFGLIGRSGSPGSYLYTLSAHENKPILYVSFWNAIRFANWLHNGQPTGAQDNTTTEGGAYTLTPTGIANNTVVRNAEATVFLPSEDEWYKAAYYKGGGTDAGYWDYPPGSDTQTACTSTPGMNAANCDFSVIGGPTPVPSPTVVTNYEASASPSGTLSQGGNVSEWNEAVINTSFRGNRGGDWVNPPIRLQSKHRPDDTLPTVAGLLIPTIGFRVASTLPASLPSLSPLCLIMLCGALGLAAARRLRA